MSAAAPVSLRLIAPTSPTSSPPRWPGVP